MTSAARFLFASALSITVSASSAAGSPVVAQANPALRDADSIVREWVDAEMIPGAVLLASRNGRVVFEQAYGWAQLYDYGDGQYGTSSIDARRAEAIRRLPTPTRMTTDTVFDLASVTKVMATTFAIMLLVDAGELDLDAPLSTYLPDFRDPVASTTGTPATAPTASSSKGKQDITLRHLLTHRSGLYQWQPVYYHAADADQAYAYIRDLPLAWTVGAERHYSDLGFMLLGLVVEAVAGKPLDAFLEERLYDPLGLTATRFRRSLARDIAANSNASGSAATSPEPPLVTQFAATSHGNPYEHRMVHDPGFGYRVDEDPDTWDGWRRYTLAGEVNDGNSFHAFGGAAGHAGLFSTAADLQVLLQLLLNRGEYRGRRYITAAGVDAFLTDTGDGQALGWQLPGGVPSGSFAHTGFTGTYVLGVPSAGLALILLTNRQNLGVNGSGQYVDVGELQREVATAMAQQSR